MRVGWTAGTALAVALCGVPLEASELFFSHGAVARGLYDALMVTEGRWFIQGQSPEDCSHVFLQDPRVDAVDSRLRITFLFSGRAAAAVGARCVGAGDTFDIRVTGVPTFAEGELLLADPRVDAPDRKLFKAVAPIVEAALRDRLRYPLRNALDWAVHDLRERTGRHVVLDDLDLSRIVVEEQGVRIGLDFGIKVN